MSEEQGLTVLCFQYTNHRGVTERRRVRPLRVRFGTAEGHATPCWLLDAHCLDRAASRSFALARMIDMKEE